MKTGVHSTDLFVKQALNHARILSTLLETNSESAVDGVLMEKCVIGTKMLANSASLLSLGDWQELLESFESLLMDYGTSGRVWGERIAQVTSELIEKEESLSTCGAGAEWDPASVVCKEEIRALLDEVALLSAMDENVDAPADDPPRETAGGSSDVEKDPTGVGNDEPPIADQPFENGAAPHGEDVEGERDEVPAEEASLLRKPGFLEGMITELDAAVERLLRTWNEWKTGSEDLPVFDLRSIKLDSHLINFYALSLVEIAAMSRKAVDEPAVSTLEHVKLVLDAYAAVLSERDGCRVDIGFLGEDVSIDASLLFDVSMILKSMVSDISQRSTERYLRIEIEVEERNGSLRWCLRDNGNNFITDSRLDRDDFLAFYPGLREVKRQLERFQGALWVEPDEDHDSRFAFTMPHSQARQTFHVWGSGETRFCMPAQQVCDVFRLKEAQILRDSRGDHVVAEGRQIPILKLSLLNYEAPEQGDRIVVAGSLEKRIAFYVHGAGNVEEGIRRKISVPSWGGLASGVAELADARIPVIEAGSMAHSYLRIQGDGCEEQSLGGIVGDEMIQDSIETPEEGGNGSWESGMEEDEDVDILVIEKSRAVRDALFAILAPARLAVRMVEEGADAVRFLKRHTSSLIVTDVRESTSAARTLMDALAAAGSEVPVIVSTAQNGEKASLLAEELGAAGYLLKPLDAKEVIRTLNQFLPLDENCALPE